MPLLSACSTQADSGRMPSATAVWVAPGTSAAASSTSPPPPPESVTLVATGDISIHQGGALTTGAAVEGGGYDFEDVFAPVAP